MAVLNNQDMTALREFDARLKAIYNEKHLQGGVPYDMNHLKTIYDHYSNGRDASCCGSWGSWLQRLAAWYCLTEKYQASAIRQANEAPQSIRDNVKRRAGRPKKV